MTNIPRLLALPLLSLASAPACQMHMVESDDSLSCEAGRCDALTFTAVGKKTLSHTTNEDETFQIGTFRQGEVVAFDLIEDDTRKWTGTVAVNFFFEQKTEDGAFLCEDGKQYYFHCGWRWIPRTPVLLDLFQNAEGLAPFEVACGKECHLGTHFLTSDFVRAVQNTFRISKAGYVIRVRFQVPRSGEYRLHLNYDPPANDAS